MAVRLYFKDTDGVVKPVPLSDSGALSVNTLYSVDRSSVHPAGVAFDVPAYTMGSGELQVFFNGILCIAGEQYVEDTATTIKFNFDLPQDAEVCAISTSSADGSVVIQTVTSQSRDSVLTAGTPFAVPNHAVGSDLIKVYLDGLLCLETEHYQEVSSSAIVFTSDIPKDMQITVTVTTVS